MPQDLFSDPGPDGEEPASSPLPPAAEEDWPEEDGLGLQQGLYLCLPAEQVTLAGFAQNGEADAMAPARCWPPSSTPWPARTARGWPGAPMTS